jgi:hypothetical protein
MPNIERYTFGEIVIDGQTYRDDVIILPDRVIPSWWRKEGHSLDPADLDDVIAAQPDTFIMGCGAHGVLRVPQSTREFLRGKGIELIEEPTPRAIAKYQAIGGGAVACGLHLTC